MGEYTIKPYSDFKKQSRAKFPHAYESGNLDLDKLTREEFEECIDLLTLSPILNGLIKCNAILYGNKVGFDNAAQFYLELSKSRG